MEMYNPPHPGEFIKEVYLEPTGQSCSTCAQYLGVSPAVLDRVLDGTQGITPELAQKLSLGLGSSPESWLRMQEIYDAWKSKASAKSLFPIAK